MVSVICKMPLIMVVIKARTDYFIKVGNVKVNRRKYMDNKSERHKCINRDKA